MVDIEKQVQPIVSELLLRDEAALLTELALRDRVIRDFPQLKDDLDPQFERPVEMGISDDARLVWQKFVDRVNRDTYALVCTEEVKLAELRAFFKNAPERFAAALVGVLIASGLVPAALAAVVAAIIAKLLLRNAQGALCEVWSERLPSK